MLFDEPRARSSVACGSIVPTNVLRLQSRLHQHSVDHRTGSLTDDVSDRDLAPTCLFLLTSDNPTRSFASGSDVCSQRLADMVCDAEDVRAQRQRRPYSVQASANSRQFSSGPNRVSGDTISHDSSA